MTPLPGEALDTIKPQDVKIGQALNNVTDCEVKFNQFVVKQNNADATERLNNIIARSRKVQSYAMSCTMYSEAKQNNLGAYFVNAPTERVAKIDIWLEGYDFHSELIWLGKEYWRKRPDGFEHQLLEQDQIDQQVSRQKSLQSCLLDLEGLESRKVSFYDEEYNNLLITGRLRKKVNAIVQVSDLALLLKSKDDLLSSVQ